MRLGEKVSLAPLHMTNFVHGQKLHNKAQAMISELKNPLHRQIAKVSQPVGMESRSFSRAFWNSNSLCLEWRGSLGTRNHPRRHF